MHVKSLKRVAVSIRCFVPQVTTSLPFSGIFALGEGNTGFYEAVSKDV